MSPFEIAAILVVLAALCGLVNHHWLKLPSAIALVIIGLVSSLGVLLIDALVPSTRLAETAAGLVAQIDFYGAVIEGMLGFLLFAGALGINADDLREHGVAIGVMATFGVLVSTALVGLGLWQLLSVPLMVALVFGALIAPTDPVAVLGIMKTAGAPKSLETKIAGESLFNDGVGVVVFLLLVALAFPAASGAHGGTPGAAAIVELFVVEAVGGAVLGGLAGYLCYRLLRTVDEYNLEIMLTLALVMGVYAFANLFTVPGPLSGDPLHFSGPIAVVVAGLFIGNTGFRLGMSASTCEHVHNFWHFVDELLNAVLFLLIGLEVFAIDEVAAGHLAAGALAIPLVLLARLGAVGLAVGALGRWQPFAPGAVPIMTWGGLRGGISVALALSLPDSEWKPLLLTATYVVVIFSVIVQGLSVGRLIGAFAGPDDPSGRRLLADD